MTFFDIVRTSFQNKLDMLAFINKKYLIGKENFNYSLHKGLPIETFK